MMNFAVGRMVRSLTVHSYRTSVLYRGAFMLYDEQSGGNFMLRRVVTIAGIAALASGTLLADFTYQETSTITGGAIASMMKVVGVFSKQAREPIQSTVSVKGDRMVHRS